MVTFHFTQASRIGRLATALGGDALVLVRFSGRDRLNDLFEYKVEALSLDEAVDVNALLGTHATVTLDGEHGTGTFDGIVSQVEWAGPAENGNRYDLTLRPWMWLAGLRRNQRIFHDKTVVDILTELFGEYDGLGDPAFEFRLQNEYPTLEYTVQYRESDLAFARRQMERHGLSFHFAHKSADEGAGATPGSHTLVVTDSLIAHDTVAGTSRPFRSYRRQHQAHGEHFRDWRQGARVTTGAVRLTEFNFKHPHAAMEVDAPGDAAHEQGKIESFDFPGDYLEQGRGREVVDIRTRAERGQAPRAEAAGDVIGLQAGLMVELSGDPIPDATDCTFVCLEARHRYTSDGYGSLDDPNRSLATGRSVGEAPGASVSAAGLGRGEGTLAIDGEEPAAYDGAYVLLRDDAPFVPERKTPRPIVHGPQTAFVVGEGEIDCDEHGRILVRFHWDLDDAYSMRCRVSQNWASKGWGGMVIPRIGMEVVVEFIEGDPDQPIVTGCVYNGENTPPYRLPEHKTRSTFKTDTHKGQGFNELRFEDEKGREEVWMHAQKDMNVEVRNNLAQDVGGHAHHQTTRNLTKLTGGFEAQHSGLGLLMSTGGTLSLSSGRGSPVSSINRSFFSTGGTIATNFTNFITDPEENLANRLGSINLNAATELSAQAGGDVAIGAGESVSIGGQETVTMTSGESVRLTAGEAIMSYAGGNMVLASDAAMILRSGESEIILRPDGEITVKGTLIVMEAGKICLN